MTIDETCSMITPVSVLLLCLIFTIKLRRDMNPIVINMVKGLSVQAQNNSMFFAMMALVAANIFFGAAADETRILGFARIAAACKVFGLTCGGVLAYLIKNSFSNPEAKTVSSVTTTNETTKTTLEKTS